MIGKIWFKKYIKIQSVDCELFRLGKAQDISPAELTLTSDNWLIKSSKFTRNVPKLRDFLSSSKSGCDGQTADVEDFQIRNFTTIQDL